MLEDQPWDNAALWLGGKKENNEWTWLSGEEFGGDQWGASPPDGNGNCIAVVLGRKTWDDASCTNVIKSICEKLL